jgi:DNA-binding CsgD family transcriptional regulator
MFLIDEKGLYISLENSMDLMHPRPTRITVRELEVLKCLSQGMSAAEIGEKLGTSHRTVDAHKKNLFMKMGVSNSAALVQKANDLNLIGKKKLRS